MRRRGLLFSVLVALCVAGAATYVALAAGGDPRVATMSDAQPAAAARADKPLRSDLRLIVRARDRLDLQLPAGSTSSTRRILNAAGSMLSSACACTSPRVAACAFRSRRRASTSGSACSVAT
jgi:hypothetical protein